MRRSQDLFNEDGLLSKWHDRKTTSTYNLLELEPRPSCSRPVRRRSYTQSPKKEDQLLTDICTMQSASSKLNKNSIAIISGEDSLLAQYGIYERIERIIQYNKLSSRCLEENKAMIQKESRKIKWRNIVHPTALFLMMFLSGFLGAFCYSFVEHYFGISKVSASPTVNSTELAVVDGNRSIEKDVIIHQLVNSIIQLEETLNSIKDEISYSKKTSSDIIPKPSRGVLEELLSSEPDLASSGNLGWVVATPDTVDYTVPAYMSVLGLFSISVHVAHKPPDTTIKGLIQEVGDCWAFQGSHGRLVLALHRPSRVTGVSLSHIPATISPTGHITTAPWHFLVLAHDTSDDLENGLLLGEFEYDQEGTWRQSFKFNKVNEIVTDIMEFRFIDNHGDPDYTCVYRVHIHGKII